MTSYNNNFTYYFNYSSQKSIFCFKFELDWRANYIATIYRIDIIDEQEKNKFRSKYFTLIGIEEWM